MNVNRFLMLNPIAHNLEEASSTSHRPALFALCCQIEHSWMYGPLFMSLFFSFNIATYPVTNITTTNGFLSSMNLYDLA